MSASSLVFSISSGNFPEETSMNVDNWAGEQLKNTYISSLVSQSCAAYYLLKSAHKKKLDQNCLKTFVFVRG